VIWVEENGIAWFGTSEGLFRYDPPIKKNYQDEYHVLLRQVSLKNGKVIYNGGSSNGVNGTVSRQGGESVPVFAYKDNSITFEFTAAFYEAAENNRFQYFLEGFDKTWSQWTTDTKAVYTNLPGGHYCFKVRAKNIFEHEGQAAVYRFSISPPWYQSTFAYVGYGIGLIIILVLAYVAHLIRVKQVILQEQRKYEKCLLDPNRAEEYTERLFQVMESEKPYLKPELSLSSLSKEMGIKRHYISQILNLQLKKSFWDFINEYRIREAQKLLSDPEKQGLSMLQVAFEVGFNSASSFSRAFKRYTGTTPTKYRAKK
jgi:AraC-like DNA-binding protein